MVCMPRPTTKIVTCVERSADLALCFGENVGLDGLSGVNDSS